MSDSPVTRRLDAPQRQPRNSRAVRQPEDGP